MASKSADVRPKITLACVECKERNYITKKNRRNNPDRLEMKKFCPRDEQAHRRTARPADLTRLDSRPEAAGDRRGPGRPRRCPRRCPIEWSPWP